jgi:YVTN family beta-propeller protein
MPTWFHSSVTAACALVLLGSIPAGAWAEVAYITNVTGNSLSVIDTTTNTVTATIAMTPQARPEGIAITPDGTKVLIANAGFNGGNGSLAILDRATNTVTSTSPLGTLPFGIAITPDGSKAYIVDSMVGGISTPNIQLVDIATGTVLDQFNAGAVPFAIAMTPDGSKLYVTDTNATVVAAVATATNTVTSFIPVGNGPAGIAMAPDGSKVYSVNTGDDAVSVIDTATDTVTMTIPVGINPFGDQVTPDGRHVWVANQTENTVSVIDTATQTVTATILVGKNPANISFTPDSRTAYVTNFADDTVSVVDTAAGTVTATIPVGAGPVSLGAFIAPALAAPPPTALVAAILPGSVSVGINVRPLPTVFATILNLTSSPLNDCQITLSTRAPGGLFLAQFQTTDPATNELTGLPDVPVTIAANGSQTFLLTFDANAPLTDRGQTFDYQCDGVAEAAAEPGVNTVDILFADTPVPDIIALVASVTPGILTIPISQNQPAAFAVATENAGVAGSITVSADTGAAALPLTLTICQTNPATAACLAPPAGTVTLNFAAGATPTFSVFATASAEVPFAPGTSRIFVRFEDASGVSHGSTSLAVETD